MLGRALNESDGTPAPSHPLGLYPFPGDKECCLPVPRRQGAVPVP